MNSRLYSNKQAGEWIIKPAVIKFGIRQPATDCLSRTGGGKAKGYQVEQFLNQYEVEQGGE